MKARSLVLLFLTLWVLSFSGYAQSGATGAIAGVVVDSEGNPVSGAQIDITFVGTTATREVFSDASGNFTVASLPVGTYDVVVKAAGFSSSKYNSVTVRLTETTRLNPSLAASSGEKTEAATRAGEDTVMVATPPVVAVETEDPATGRSVEADVIGALPLATQNFHQLLTLSAGAISDLNASAQLGRGDVGIHVNGQREDNNNYLLDGISVTDLRNSELFNTPLPSPDAVQEFKVQTSLYDATEGRNGGGNINAVLKSGTPHWHGSVFEFFRNDVLNANEYFQNREGQPRPVVKQNLFGGSLGGPLGHDAEGGYLFVNYQGTRQISGLSPGTIISTVLPVLPSDRSAASLSMAGFGNAFTPIDPVILALLNVQSNQFGGAGGGWLIPSLSPSNPANPAAGAAFNLSTPGKFNDDQFTTDYDRQFKDGRDKISGRFFFSNFRSYLPFGAGDVPSTPGEDLTYGDLSFPVDLPVRNRFLSVMETHIFGPRVVNEARFGFLDLQFQNTNQPVVTADQLGIVRPSNNLTTDTYRFTLLGVNIGPNDSYDLSQNQHTFTWSDTVSYSLGRHFVRFGGLFTHTGMDRDFPQNFNGLVGFNSLQAFLLGIPAYAFDSSGASNHHFLLNDSAAYIQDDYKVTRNLTANLGLRWDLISAPQDSLHRIANVDPSLLAQGQSPFVYSKSVGALNIPGLAGTASETGRSNNYASNWGPRIGFAYDVLGKHTTSVRGGYAIYYERESLGVAQQLASQAPFAPSVTAFGTTPGQLATMFNGLLPAAGAIDPSYIPQPSFLVGFIDPTTGQPTNDPNMYPIFSGSTYGETAMSVPLRYVSPSTQQWNLTVQRSLPKSWVMEVGYVGSKATHLSAALDPMQALLASPQNPITVEDVFGNTYTITQNTQLNVGARSPQLGLNPRGYFQFVNSATSHYNSLQATLAHQFANGLHFQGAYTMSRSTDPVVTSGAGIYQFTLNDQAALGPLALSDFDRTHRLVLSYRYELPFFARAHGLQSAVLGHWSVGGVTVYQSGVPFRVSDSTGGSAYGAAFPDTATPSLAPGYTVSSALTTGPIEQRLTTYLNPAAFVPAPVVGIDGSTGFGTLGRNVFRGPFQQSWDMSLAKSWTVSEAQSLKFSADFFNVWNHPVFDKPSITDIENPSFGQITNTVGTPRLVQLSLRYAF
ncbi:MAG TPA: carboxypeptidase regulatory-like domain-containing protein [Candidatus Solibacter sp.]|nr:carboxypeptidase regulatory-like domain-containing protein [Candidatus Solibacter sp.]